MLLAEADGKALLWQELKSGKDLIQTPFGNLPSISEKVCLCVCGGGGGSKGGVWWGGQGGGRTGVKREMGGVEGVGVGTFVFFWGGCSTHLS